ncbi:MAG: dynamin family protein [Acidimicrobiales bacterium]
MTALAGNLEILSRTLGISFDHRRLAALLDRADAQPSIAVLGLVNRGKSTLINELIGVQLCPVNDRGETVAVTRIANGPLRTDGWDSEGNLLDIGPSSNEFARALLRSHSTQVVRAHYESPDLRLPTGFALVDTPGLDDPASMSQEYGFLQQSWMLSSATGAVVVVAFPPGPSRQDLQLINSAKEIFGEALGVIIKALDSEVTLDDLVSVADYLVEQHEIRPVIVPNTEASLTWGEGKLAAVDQLLVRLVQRGEAVRSDSLESARDALDMLARTIASVPEERLSHLQRSLGIAKRIHPLIAEAVRERVTGILAERQQIVEAERMRQLALEQRRLDDFSDSLGGLLPSDTDALDPVIHGQTIREIVALAEQGSMSALGHLERIGRRLTADRRERFGLSVSRILEVFPVSALEALLSSWQLSLRDVEVLLSSSDEEVVEVGLLMPDVRRRLMMSDRDEIDRIRQRCDSEVAWNFLDECLELLDWREFSALVRSCNDIPAVHQLHLAGLEMEFKYGSEAKVLRNDVTELPPGSAIGHPSGIHLGLILGEWFAGNRWISTADGKRACARVLQSRIEMTVESALDVKVDDVVTESDSYRSVISWIETMGDKSVVASVEPWKGGGELSVWASRCESERDRAVQYVEAKRAGLVVRTLLTWFLLAVAFFGRAKLDEGSGLWHLMDAVTVLLVIAVVYLHYKVSTVKPDLWRDVFVPPTFPPETEIAEIEFEPERSTVDSPAVESRDSVDSPGEPWCDPCSTEPTEEVEDGAVEMEPLRVVIQQKWALVAVAVMMLSGAATLAILGERNVGSDVESVVDTSTVLNSVAQPVQQSFVDFTSGEWTVRVANGGCNPDTSDDGVMTVGRMMGATFVPARAFPVTAQVDLADPSAVMFRDLDADGDDDLLVSLRCDSRYVTALLIVGSEWRVVDHFSRISGSNLVEERNTCVPTCEEGRTFEFHLKWNGEFFDRVLPELTFSCSGLREEENGPPVEWCEEGGVIPDLQAELMVRGAPRIRVDGQYGPATAAAVAWVQATTGREVTGQVDEDLGFELLRP